jgi:hypothetical protein
LGNDRTSEYVQQSAINQARFSNKHLNLNISSSPLLLFFIFLEIYEIINKYERGEKEKKEKCASAIDQINRINSRNFYPEDDVVQLRWSFFINFLDT